MSNIETQSERSLKSRIRILILLFMTGMILSGITAFPIETELEFMNKHLESFPSFMHNWLSNVYIAVKNTNANYPWLSYGTDWLAFAHLVIAVAFIGPLKDPVKNKWVIEFGMISCFMVFPLALIAGEVRQIPFYWRLIDCSFGVFGFVVLYSCYRLIIKLSSLNSEKTN